MPAITVAVTCHNLEKYIAGCIDQLRCQSFQDFEILVYDDCSTDRSREILLQCQQELGERFELILGRIPQKLPGRSRNMLLDSGKIRGEYIVFLDGDDVIEPDFLEKLYSAARDNTAEIAVCAYDRFEDDSGHVLCVEMQAYPPRICMEHERERSLAFINTSLWNKLIRVDCIGTLRMPEFSVGEDASFLQAIYMNCKSIAFVDQVLIHYRVRHASVISNTP